jgi:CheY-like chemotaxis protein
VLLFGCRFCETAIAMKNHQSTILVVDDNDINLKLVSYLLEFDGRQIITAMNASQALVAVQLSSPDLILMDLCLPGMDGLTLTRKLKADEKTRHIIIVALTASVRNGDKQKALSAGCDGYITKPINTRELPKQIAGFLQRAEDEKMSMERTPLIFS